jgi:hypothetical protein
MDELTALVGEIEDNINSFLADAKKQIAPKSAWQRARKTTITLQKQFKEFRSLSVQVAKLMKKEKN